MRAARGQVQDSIQATETAIWSLWDGIGEKVTQEMAGEHIL